MFRKTAKMSTESIADARSLRQFLAREAIEKETSIGQSPDMKLGKKSKTLNRAQKNMQKERRGNSQVNHQKKYKKLRKEQKNHKNNKITKIYKKTTWKEKKNAAKMRRRERRAKFR